MNLSKRDKRIINDAKSLSPGTTYGKFLTVYNVVTHNSVPFTRSEFGEILLNSTYSEDIEDNCIVMVGNVYFQDSIDLLQVDKISNRL